MNKNKIAIIFIVIFSIIIGFSYYLYQQKNSDSLSSDTKESANMPATQDIELVAHVFVQNFIKSSPPQPDPQAIEEAYDALSVNAKTQVSSDFISRDLATFVGVQDVPRNGFSVEDLKIISSDKAQYIVSFLFSDTRAIKAINLISEDGQWKVDSVDTLEQYP